MQSIPEMYSVFQNIVALASQVPIANVIPADEGRSAPLGLYATYKPIPVRAVGHPRKERTDIDAEDTTIYEWTDFSEVTITSMEFMLSCNFFNEGSEDAAIKLHNANFRNPVQALLYANEIGWRYCSEVRNLSSLSQASMQPRYQVDINLYVDMEITDVVLRAAGVVINIYNENDDPL